MNEQHQTNKTIFGIEIPVFRDSTVEECAILTLHDVYGQSRELDHYDRIDTRKFLRAMSGMTIDNFSLESVKKAIANVKEKSRLHRIIYQFIIRFEKHYAGPDEEAFRSILPYIKKKQRMSRKIFGPDVTSFEVITYTCCYGKTYFYILRTENELLRDLFKQQYTKTGFITNPTPTQTRTDLLIKILERNMNPPGTGGKPFSVGGLFRIMDNIKDLFLKGKIDANDKRDLISETMRFYRYCLGKNLVEAEAPLTNLSLIGSKGTTQFFLSGGYISREKTYIFRNHEQKRTGHVITIDIDNPFIRTAIGQLLLSGKVATEEYHACRDTFVDSLGDYADTIRSNEDWNEATLFHQVNYYRRLYEGKKQRTYALSFIKTFYLTVNNLTNGGFFRKARTLTYRSLSSHQFIVYCDMGYEFRPYSDYEVVTEGKRIVFIVKGLNKKMRKYGKVDCISVDFSEITNDYYRNIAWRAITSKEERLYRTQFRHTLRHLLGYLAKLKRKDGWWTPDFKTFSFYDALATAAFFLDRSESIHTYNNWMFNTRDFLRWAENTRHLAVEKVAYDILSNMKIVKATTNTPIVPDKHLDTIMAYFANRAKDDTNYAQALILLNLISLTPLRIGHACSLLEEELVYDTETESYFVHSTSKTTNGDETTTVLGRHADRFIRKALSLSREIGLQRLSICVQRQIPDLETAPLRKIPRQSQRRLRTAALHIQKHQSNIHDSCLRRSQQGGVPERIRPKGTLLPPECRDDAGTLCEPLRGLRCAG